MGGAANAAGPTERLMRSVGLRDGRRGRLGLINWAREVLRRGGQRRGLRGHTRRRRATGSGGQQEGFAPPDAQAKLAEPAAAKGKLVATHLPAVALPLARRCAGRPGYGSSHPLAGFRMKPALQETKLLRPPTSGRGRCRARAGGGQTGAPERRVRTAPDSPEGVAGPHQAVRAVSASGGPAGFDVSTTAGRP